MLTHQRQTRLSSSGEASILHAWRPPSAGCYVSVAFSRDPAAHFPTLIHIPTRSQTHTHTHTHTHWDHCSNSLSPVLIHPRGRTPLSAFGMILVFLRYALIKTCLQSLWGTVCFIVQWKPCFMVMSFRLIGDTPADPLRPWALVKKRLKSFTKDLITIFTLEFWAFG